MKILFTIVLVLPLLLILLTLPKVITVTQSHALQQVAGDIVVNVNPGETKTFRWGLLSEKNVSNMLNITADGIGAEFLSFPENITLNANEQITYVPVNVSIPSNYTGVKELSPSIRATQAGEQVGATIINIAMSKVLCVIVAQNITTTVGQGFEDLQFKDYTQNVVDRDQGRNQSITIRIESTSNITEFNFNETKNQLSFKAAGDAGTNGTAILYASEVLQEPYSLVVDGIVSTDFDIITNTTTGERAIQIIYRHNCMDNNIILTGAKLTMQNLT
jgi:hypothetical protein